MMDGMHNGWGMGFEYGWIIGFFVLVIVILLAFKMMNKKKK
jgi:ABC-type multidrug transport system permease subunit